MTRMKMSRAGVAIALLLAPVAVQSHTSLERSEPASGSVMTASPPVLTLTFLKPAALTALTLATAAGERRLPFTPSGSALTFSAPRPGLSLGRNEIRWRALSNDGHVIEGSIIIVLRSAAR